MLLGEHEHTLDEKNRLTLPAKLRGAFEDGLVVTRGLDGCLNAWPRADWERLAERIQGLDQLAESSRVMQRHFFAFASPGELDRQGRLVIPAALLQHAGIDREVVVAGVFDHIEIWDRERWRSQPHQQEGRAEDAAERLAN
jgi:MraZ protein